MPGPIKLQFANFSGALLHQSDGYTGYEVERGVGSLSMMPTDTLSAYGGSTTMEMDENALSNIAGGYAWIALGWKDPSTGYHFGVRIYMPVQVAHVGHQPYYETSCGMSSTPTWAKPVSNPAYPYTFPKDHFLINCTPTAEHTSLTVKVSVSDLDG